MRTPRSRRRARCLRRTSSVARTRSTCARSSCSPTRTRSWATGGRSCRTGAAWGLTLTNPNPNPNPNPNTNPNPTGVSCVRTTRPLWARSTPSRSPPRGGTRRASQTRGYPNPNPNPNLNPNPNPNSNPNLSPNPNPNPNPNPSPGTRRSWQTAASTSARGRRSRKPSRRMLTRAPAVRLRSWSGPASHLGSQRGLPAVHGAIGLWNACSGLP